MGSSPNPINTITGQTSAGQYGFVDPTQSSAAMTNLLYGQNGAGGLMAGGPMGTFNQNVGNVMGLTGPLAQTLAGTAAYQGQNALNLASQNFANQGALGSGAGAQAFGQAIANPFAQATAQLQQGQLGLANSLMGASANTYNAGLGAAGNLMEHTSGLVAPTYMTNPAYAQQQQGKGQAAGAGMGALGAGLGSMLGPVGTALGGAVGSGLGGKGTGPSLSPSYFQQMSY